jgi:hypothetical protein
MPSVRSDADTVHEYLASSPQDRRGAIEQVRQVILDNLPDGYEEVMNWGMITYQVPLEVEPDTYNGRPLMYAAVASQKRHMAVYLTSVYADPDSSAAFREAYLETGKPLDMGQSCVRFKRLEDLPLDLLGTTIASTPIEQFVAMAARRPRSQR